MPFLVLVPYRTTVVGLEQVWLAHGTDVTPALPAPCTPPALIWLPHPDTATAILTQPTVWLWLHMQALGHFEQCKDLADHVPRTFRQLMTYLRLVPELETAMAEAEVIVEYDMCGCCYHIFRGPEEVGVVLRSAQHALGMHAWLG